MTTATGDKHLIIESKRHRRKLLQRGDLNLIPFDSNQCYFHWWKIDFDKRGREVKNHQETPFTEDE